MRSTLRRILLSTVAGVFVGLVIVEAASAQQGAGAPQTTQMPDPAPSRSFGPVPGEGSYLLLLAATPQTQVQPQGPAQAQAQAQALAQAQPAVRETAAPRPVMLAQLRPGETPPPPPHPEPPRPGQHPSPDRAGPPPHRAPPGPMEIAGLLAAQEVALGIRADQLDAWRAYASAVVELAGAQAPLPPPPPASPEPFGLSQAFATRAVEAGEKGRAVLEARTALLAKLSPAQIERARTLDMPPPPPPAGPAGALPPPPPAGPAGALPPARMP